MAISFQRPKAFPQSGDLNTRGILQQPTTTQDQNGQASLTYTNIAKVWMSVIAMSGAEGRRGNQVESTVTHTVWLHYTRHITSSWRIELNCCRILELVSVTDPDNRQNWLVCQCVEVPS